MVLQHNSPYSAPCEGVAPSRYFRRQTFISATPAMKRRLHSSCSPHFVIAGALSPHMSLKARKYPWGSAPSPMRGYYTLALPCYLFIAHSNTRFVKEQRRKNLQGKLAKFFAPLTTTENNIINTRAERSPAPRLNCPTLRRCPLRRTVFPAEVSAGRRIKQLGTGQKCQIFKQFCPVPNCLIFQNRR